MPDRDEVMQWLETCVSGCEDGCPYEYKNLVYRVECKADLMRDAIALLKEQKAVVRCRDCKHWDKTTRKEGNDCIFGPWEEAECDVFRDWDTYGDLGEDFRRTNGDWFCANGERR